MSKICSVCSVRAVIRELILSSFYKKDVRPPEFLFKSFCVLTNHQAKMPAIRGRKATTTKGVLNIFPLYFIKKKVRFL